MHRLTIICSLTKRNRRRDQTIFR